MHAWTAPLERALLLGQATAVAQLLTWCRAGELPALEKPRLQAAQHCTTLHLGGPRNTQRSQLWIVAVWVSDSTERIRVKVCSARLEVTGKLLKCSTILCTQEICVRSHCLRLHSACKAY